MPCCCSRVSGWHHGLPRLPVVQIAKASTSVATEATPNHRSWRGAGAGLRNSATSRPSAARISTPNAALPTWPSTGTLPPRRCTAIPASTATPKTTARNAGPRCTKRISA